MRKKYMVREYVLLVIMDLKRYLVVGLISFGFGVLVGWHPTFESIRNYLITGISIGLIVALGALGVEILGLLSQNREKKEKAKLSHSQKLVDKELKPITDSHIRFYDSHSLKLYVEGLKSSDQTYDNYSNEVNAHLEKGYPEVWKHKTECESIIKNHNALAKLLLNATVEEILKEINKINLSFIEWNGKGQPPKKYFAPEYLFIDVGYVIQYSYERIFDIDQYYVINLSDNSSNPTTNGEYLRDQLAISYPEYCKWKLKFNHVLAEGDKNVMEELKRIIKAALNIALTKDDFSKLKNYKKDAEREHNFFYKEIIEIIKNVDNGIPLNDECKICKNY